MNILLEIADKDLIFIGFVLSGLVLLAIVIFFAFVKNKVVITIEDEEESGEALSEEQIEAKAELERVFNQMKVDLENQKEEVDIETFEREQEENAIISYQELIKQVEDKKEKPAPKMKEKIIKEPEEPKKFKNSDIISPIFGIQNKETSITVKQEKNSKPSIENTYEEFKKSYEDENNKEFLNSLKEFRKNL